MSNTSPAAESYSSRHFQAVIIGGGIGGGATALALARAGQRVAVIERVASVEWKAGEGLPAQCKPLLQRLGVWERFLAEKHLPSYGKRSAWGSARLAESDSIFDVHGPGWQLDRRKFEQMLRSAAQEAGAIWFCPTQIHGPPLRVAGIWRLLVGDGDKREGLTAEVVVDATGPASWFAARQGVRRARYDRLVAVTSLLSPRKPPSDARTLVEAVAGGWWYSALLPDGKVAAIYLTDADLLPGQQLKTAAGWWEWLSQTRHTRRLLETSGCQVVAGPRLVSAVSSSLTAMSGDSWLAVGDAATSFDPLSSQGMMNALANSIMAAQAILERGDGSAFQQYESNLRRAYREYLAHHRDYYALEQRWPESPFWRRRATAHPFATIAV